MDAIVFSASSGNSKACVRIAGDTRWETSAAFARWAAANGYLSAEGAAFAAGATPWDALGGGALQGREGSVLLLVGEGATSDATSAVAASGGATSIKFLGGMSAVNSKSRMATVEDLGLSICNSLRWLHRKSECF